MKLYKKAQPANEDFIDWFTDRVEDTYTGTLIDELSDIEFNSDLEARAGYKQLTGNEPQSYTLNISEPKDASGYFSAVRGPHALSGGKWSDRAISKAYKDPRLEKFWRKIDGKSAGDEYLRLLKKVLRLEAWLGHQEKHYDEKYLWNMSKYHQSLIDLRQARWEIDRLAKEYDLPPIDIDMLIEETQ